SAGRATSRPWFCGWPGRARAGSPDRWSRSTAATRCSERRRVTSSPFGARQPRREDARLMTGRGRYVGDVELPRMLHVAFVRSVHAHATLSAIAATRALASAGVVHVATRADETFARHRLTGRSAAPGYLAKGQPILAWPIARHAGEPVAPVVATRRCRA